VHLITGVIAITVLVIRVTVIIEVMQAIMVAGYREVT